VIQTNATSSFHVIFSSAPGPSRNTDEPVLRFVVGKRQNSMTSVGLGNPYNKKEPIDFTKKADALLTKDAEKSNTYWFLYDKTVCTAAMGSLASPTAENCRLAVRFRDTIGFRAEICEGLRYVSVSSGKRAVSLRILGVGGPPDVSIPRFKFDPVTWLPLPWRGASCVFELDVAHRELLQKVQALVAKSPVAPFYSFVDPSCFCLNAYRLLDPHRRGELAAPGDDPDTIEWRDCYGELYRRLGAVLQSAPWTYFPMRLEKVDCTTVTLAPAGQGCDAAVRAWTRAIQNACHLRNGATPREMWTCNFAFEVFPVEGENAVQVRRELVKEISTLLAREWGTLEARSPALVTWQTHVDYKVYEGSESVAQPPAAPSTPPL